MLNAGHPGFVHAPVTKTIIALVVLCTVFGSIIGSQLRLTLRMQEVVQQYQLWRLFTHHFVFTTPGELLFGVVLLYFFRQFERQMGSSRYAAFALITCSVYTVILSALQLAFPNVATPASGPYALIFAALVYFFFETPKVYHFQLLGAVELSDKSFAYLLALQLVFSSPPRSLLSFSAALIAGVLYRIPPIRDHADIPQAIVTPCSTYLLPLLATNQRPGNARPARPQSFRITRNAIAIGGRELGQTPISESHVDTLVAMGFSREQAIAALQQSQDDVQRATEQLLSSSG